MDTQSVEPMYYKLRITPPDQEEPVDGVYERENINTSMLFLTAVIGILTPYVDGFLTSGMELLNSKGNETWLHYHIHFRSKSKKDTISKQLRRVLKEQGVDLVGIKSFSFKQETYVVEEKFYRYPLKQGCVVRYRDTALHIGFSDEKLKSMSAMANDCWKIGCEVNNSKADKKEDADSLYQRILAKFIKAALINPEDWKICEFLITFYQNEKRAINLTTIKGYVNNLKLDTGQITAEQMAKLAYGCV